MANPFPAAVKARLAASGSGAAVSLLEVATVTGNRFYWSDAAITAPAALPTVLIATSGVATSYTFKFPQTNFVPWLVGAGPFRTYRNTTTSSGEVVVQNLSGDTVRRAIALLYASTELIGALVFYRMWLADCEYATFSFMGTIDSVSISADGNSMTLQLESMCNWARLKAPDKQIGVACPLAFGLVQCGSTSPTPCNNDYGSCSSTERFMGIIEEWTGSALNPNQYVQPAQLNLTNTRVAG